MKLAKRILEMKNPMQDLAKEFNDVAVEFVKPRIKMNTLAKRAAKIDKTFGKKFKDKADKITQLMKELELLVEDELFKD